MNDAVEVSIRSDLKPPVPEASAFRVGRDGNRMWNFFCDLCAWEQHMLRSAFVAAIHAVDHYISNHHIHD